MNFANFPRTTLEFHDTFGTEEACRDYLFSVRWPNGFVCPHCGFQMAYLRTKREEWICASCDKATSLRSGTVLHNSRKPLREWLTALFYVISSKQSISALELKRVMGFGSYNTALRWLREIRRAISKEMDGRPPLTGAVEADLMVFGSKKEGANLAGLSDPTKTIVAGAVEQRKSGSGRARLRLVTSNKTIAKEVRTFQSDQIAPGSIIFSDGSPYRSPQFFHAPMVAYKENQSNRMRDGSKVAEGYLPRIHRVFSLLKRILRGCHQGSFSKRHIQGYLDEYCFRFEGRRFSTPLAMLPELATAVMSVKAVPYWRSSGRPTPNASTRKANREWIDFGTELQEGFTWAQQGT